jgi:hypothetical protein
MEAELCAPAVANAAIMSAAPKQHRSRIPN